MAALTEEDERKKPRSIVIIGAASVLEKCDEQILPALYAWVGAAFDATPTQLGNLALARAVVQALTSPVGGIASSLYPRNRIIAVGCLIWAVFTGAFATLSSYRAALAVLAFNGLGLALVIPNTQSLVADYFAPEKRGRAFGALWLTISLGGMLGALFATNVGALQVGSLEGWRFVFLSVAALSLVVGALSWALIHDPCAREVHARSRLGRGNDVSATLEEVGASLGMVLKIPTFLLIIFQGIIGSVPYASLIFLTLYLQLLGMSDAAAGALVATYLAGGGVGGLLGGWVGDLASQVSPDHGRILATQFSVFIGVPFAFAIFKLLPHNGDAGSVAAYAVTIAAFAVLTAWPGPCCNNPVFAEIVPPQQRNLVYAFDRCFEGAVAAFAAPFVGALAEHWFGFEGTSKVTGDRDRDLANARALGNALLCFLTVPWTCCLAVYTGLHWTYPRDRRLALQLSDAPLAAEEELEDLAGRREARSSCTPV